MWQNFPLLWYEVDECVMYVHKCGVVYALETPVVLKSIQGCEEVLYVRKCSL